LLIKKAAQNYGFVASPHQTQKRIFYCISSLAVLKKYLFLQRKFRDENFATEISRFLKDNKSL